MLEQQTEPLIFDERDQTHVYETLFGADEPTEFNIDAAAVTRSIHEALRKRAAPTTTPPRDDIAAPPVAATKPPDLEIFSADEPTEYNVPSPAAPARHSGAHPKIKGPPPRLSGAHPKIKGPPPRHSGAHPRVSGVHPRAQNPRAEPVIKAKKAPPEPTHHAYTVERAAAERAADLFGGEEITEYNASPPQALQASPTPQAPAPPQVPPTPQAPQAPQALPPP